MEETQSPVQVRITVVITYSLLAGTSASFWEAEGPPWNHHFGHLLSRGFNAESLLTLEGELGAYSGENVLCPLSGNGKSCAGSCWGWWGDVVTLPSQAVEEWNMSSKAITTWGWSGTVSKCQVVCHYNCPARDCLSLLAYWSRLFIHVSCFVKWVSFGVLPSALWSIHWQNVKC